MITLSYILWWAYLYRSLGLASNIPNFHQRRFLDDDNASGALGIIEQAVDGAKGAVDTLEDFLIPGEEASPRQVPEPDLSLPKKVAPGSGSNPATTDSGENGGVPTFRLQIDNDCEKTGPGDAETPNRCDTRSPMIIYPKICNHEKNQIITNALQNIPGRQGHLYISQDSCGVFLWRDELTRSEISKLREDLVVDDAILAILPDQILDVDPPGFPRSQSQKRDFTKTREPTLLGKVPDNLIFVSNTNPKGINLINLKDKWAELRSTPGSGTGFAYQKDYLYFARSGQDVKIYMFGSGVRESAADFRRKISDTKSTSIIDRWIFAMQTDRTREDDSYRGSGTCRTSVGVGKYHGVVENSRLVVVKCATSLSSFLDGIVQTKLDIEMTGLSARGFTVVSIDRGFLPRGDEHERQLKVLMRRLTLELQVVVVAESGQDMAAMNVDQIPALWSLDDRTNIITAGAILSRPGELWGRSTVMTKKGPAITVSAPGDVYCAAHGRDDRDHTADRTEYNPSLGGTPAAGGMVAGLAAYFLSLEDLGPLIRAQSPFIVKAVKDVIVYFAFPRFDGGPLAIGNGVKGWNFKKIKADLEKIWASNPSFDVSSSLLMAFSEIWFLVDIDRF